MFVALDAGRVAFVLDADRQMSIDGDDGIVIWRDRFLRLERLLADGGMARVAELGIEVNCGDCAVIARTLEYARRFREMEREAETQEAVDAAEDLLKE